MRQGKSRFCSPSFGSFIQPSLGSVSLNHTIQDFRWKMPLLHDAHVSNKKRRVFKKKIGMASERHVVYRRTCSCQGV